jgi:hypothetical protein
MAIGPIQINDMKWFGNPTDLVGSFQKGMNLAEQAQKMGQSSDVHAMKLVDMASTTAARDQQTSLAKQSYDFNELTQADRVSSVNALARRNQVYANIAEKTEQAQVNMQNIQALEKARDWDIKKGVNIATAQRAAEAGLEKIITEQEKNAATADSYINRYKAETKGTQHRTSLLGLQTDLANRLQDFRFNAVSGQLIQQAGDADRANKKHQEWLDGYPTYREGVSRIEDAVSRGDYQALRNMTFPNTTDDQTKQLKALISQRLNNDAGQRAQIAAEARQTELKNTTGKLPLLSDEQMEAIEKNGGFDPKTGALTATGQKHVNRMSKQNEILEGLNLSMDEQRELIMQASKADPEDEVAMFSFSTTLDKPFSTDSVNLSNRKVSTYGSKVGDTFVLNRHGLENLEKLVATKKSAVAAADRAAKIGQAQDFGMIPTNVKIDEKGNITYELTQNALTQKEQVDSINSIAKDIQASRAQRLLEPLGPVELYKQALQAHGIANVKIAGDGDDVRRLGLGDGDRFFNYDKGVFQRIQDGKAVSSAEPTQGKAMPSRKPKESSNYSPPDSSFTPEQRQYNEVVANKDMIGADLEAMGASPELSRWMILTASKPKAGINYSTDMETSKLIAGVRGKAARQMEAIQGEVYDTLFEDNRFGKPAQRRFDDPKNNSMNDVYKELKPYFGKAPSEYPEKIKILGQSYPIPRTPDSIQMLESRLNWWKDWRTKDFEMARIGMKPLDESGRDSRYQNPSYSAPPALRPIESDPQDKTDLRTPSQMKPTQGNPAANEISRKEVALSRLRDRWARTFNTLSDSEAIALDNQIKQLESEIRRLTTPRK